MSAADRPLRRAPPIRSRSSWSTACREVRLQLEEIVERLPRYQKAAADELRKRLDLLTARSESPMGGEGRDKVVRMIDEGQLSIAEDLLYCLETGKEIPVWEPDAAFASFYPAVPDAVPGGITGEMLEIVRSGGIVVDPPVLDFGTLSEVERERAGEALSRWRDFSALPLEARAGSQPELLLAVFRLIGIEGKAFEESTQAPGRDRRFVELVKMRVLGKATVPVFGSKLGVYRKDGGRLTVLLAWGGHPADRLMNWIDQAQSDDPVLVLYFGTMKAAERAALAQRSLSTNAPVIVLDDAALLYLLARNEAKVSATLAITLPFAKVNPYLRGKRGEVAVEMFYGRERELKDLVDFDGPQIVYGGRGLGKSALLRSGAARFEKPEERKAVYLDIKEEMAGKDGIQSDAVWDLLRKALTDAEVLPQQKPRGKASPEVARTAVRDGIRSWLEADDKHRLLILLDEADGFFQADSPDFGETIRLKGLGAETDGRVKVVFAGLHSVHRFSKIENMPFHQLAVRELAVRPLAHRNAFDLVTVPLRSLGMEFDDPDLIHRINGTCAYQPFLLQMFAHRLVELMQRRRATESSAPPYWITVDEIEAVESDHVLRGDIVQVFRDTLNLDPRYNLIANVLESFNS